MVAQGSCRMMNIMMSGLYAEYIKASKMVEEMMKPRYDELVVVGESCAAAEKEHSAAKDRTDDECDKFTEEHRKAMEAAMKPRLEVIRVIMQETGFANDDIRADFRNTRVIIFINGCAGKPVILDPMEVEDILKPWANAVTAELAAQSKKLELRKAYDAKEREFLDLGDKLMAEAMNVAEELRVQKFVSAAMPRMYAVLEASRKPTTATVAQDGKVMEVETTTAV